MFIEMCQRFYDCFHYYTQNYKAIEIKASFPQRSTKPQVSTATGEVRTSSYLLQSGGYMARNYCFCSGISATGARWNVYLLFNY